MVEARALPIPVTESEGSEKIEEYSGEAVLRGIVSYDEH